MVASTRSIAFLTSLGNACPSACFPLKMTEFLSLHRLSGRIVALGGFEELVSTQVRVFLVEALKVVRLAQQKIIRLGKVPQGDLARAVLALGAGLVELAAVERNLGIGRVDGLVAYAALGHASAAVLEHFHAFGNAGHGCCLNNERNVRKAKE